MPHVWAFSHETENDHVFQCSVCGAFIGFNKPGIGTPNAVMVNDVLTPPEDADKYVDACIEEPE